MNFLIRTIVVANLVLVAACTVAPHTRAETPSRYALSIDNDLFAPGGLDRDYTGGARLAATRTGRELDRLLPGERILSWLDRLSTWNNHFRDSGQSVVDKTFSAGLLAFAPEDLAAEEPVDGERPYANLLYVARSRFATSPSGRNAYQSTLTVGLLGTPLAEWAHRSIHRTTGATIPKGYSHQIADGGELTARYAVALHRFLLARSGRFDTDLRVRLDGAAGFVTGLGSSMTARIGRFAAGSWSLRSEQAGYLTQAYVAPPLRNGDWIAWASVGVQAQLHNAFLHGQFRHREAALDHSRTAPFSAEWGLGLTLSVRGSTTLDYALRGRSREVDTAAGGRSMLWGSITLTHHLGR